MPSEVIVPAAFLRSKYLPNRCVLNGRAPAPCRVEAPVYRDRYTRAGQYIPRSVDLPFTDGGLAEWNRYYTTQMFSVALPIMLLLGTIFMAQIFQDLRTGILIGGVGIIAVAVMGFIITTSLWWRNIPRAMAGVEDRTIRMIFPDAAHATANDWRKALALWREEVEQPAAALAAENDRRQRAEAAARARGRQAEAVNDEWADEVSTGWDEEPQSSDPADPRARRRAGAARDANR